MNATLHDALSWFEKLAREGKTSGGYVFPRKAAREEIERVRAAIEGAGWFDVVVHTENRDGIELEAKRNPPPPVPRGFIRVDLAEEKPAPYLLRVDRIICIAQEESCCLISLKYGGHARVTQSLAEVQQLMVEEQG